MAEELYTNKIIPHKTNILWGLIVLFFIGVTAGLTVFSLNKTYAADETCYWVGSTSNWNDSNNWSNASGGAAGTCAVGVPDSGTAVIFDSADTTTVSPEVDINIDSLDLQTGYGTFDNATNDRAITVANNVTMDNTRVDMGDATWTVSGSFDNENVSTFNRNASTLVMNGDGTSLIGYGSGTALNNLIINSGKTITATSSTSGGGPRALGTTDIYGIITIPSDRAITSYPGDYKVHSGGKITGQGTLALATNAGISQQDGTVDVATLKLFLDIQLEQ